MCSLLCPLCAQTSFTSIDALRNSLIKAANGPLPCPICNELFLGLDKLTIHLFSHTNLMTTQSSTDENEIMSKIPVSPIQQQHQHSTMTNLASQSPTILPSTEKQNKKAKTKQTTKIKEMQTHTMQVVAKNLENSNIQSLQPTTTTSEINEQLSSCDICEFTFRNAELRDMHFVLVHQNSNLITNSPHSLATQSTSKITPETGIIPDFKCHLCAKTFKMKGSLRVHLKVVHNPNNSPKLNICDRIRHKDQAKVQQNLKTNTSNTKPQQLNVVSSVKPANLINSPHISNLVIAPIVPEGLKTVFNQANDIAMQNFDTSLLNSNVVLVYTPQCGELNKDLVNKSAAENPKIWECDVCAKSFTTKYFLKKHKRLHTGEMPYTCEICARTFTFQQSYHKHLLYHSDEKPHICAICGRAFKELSTLHNHERIHSGEKPFKCEICGKCFRQRVSFLVHTRIHTGVMPYKCEQCQKNFRYKVSLRTHKCLPTSDVQAVETVNDVKELLDPKSELSNEHITENFIKSFLENNNLSAVDTNESQNSPASLEIATITNNCSIDPHSVEAYLSKTIDDIVVESCNKMGIGNEVHLTTSPSLLSTHSDGSNSPLQKLQNMRLYSPKYDMEINTNQSTGDFSEMFFK